MNLRTLYKNLLLVGLIGLLATACNKVHEPNNNIDQHRAQQLDNLRDILCAAPNGWHMVYFPDVNKSLNTNISENYKTHERATIDVFLLKRMGVGGYNLFVKFEPNGKMAIITDIAYHPTDSESSYTPQYHTEISQAEYGLSVADGLGLYFRTKTMVEELYPFNIKATNRFFVEQMSKDKIVLRTNHYIEHDREYIVMTPNQTPQTDWPAQIKGLIAEKEAFRLRSYSNAKQEIAEDRLCVFQVRLADSKTILYQTTNDFGQGQMKNRLSKSYAKDVFVERRIARYDHLQYELFLKNEQPERTFGGHDGSTYYTGLGSGFAATPEGLEFKPGFRYNDKVIFTHFKRAKEKKEWISQSGIYEGVITFVEKTNN